MTAPLLYSLPTAAPSALLVLVRSLVLFGVFSLCGSLGVKTAWAVTHPAVTHSAVTHSAVTHSAKTGTGQSVTGETVPTASGIDLESAISEPLATGVCGSASPSACVQRDVSQAGDPEAGETGRGGSLGPGTSVEDRGAPMCDPSAASVVAVPIIPDAQGGSLEELPCEQWRLLQTLMDNPSVRDFLGVHCNSREQVPAGSQQSRLDMPAVIAGDLWCLARAVSKDPLSLASADVKPDREYRRGVYRPPLHS